MMGRRRSLGCVMLIEMFVFFSRSWRAISMRPCHPVHCTRRAAKGLRDINGRLAAERRQKGREACMRRSERAVRTPWRQECRQRYAQERRHLSSAMRHRWGRALTRVFTCAGVHVRPCGASTQGVCTGRRRDQGARPTEILHVSSAVGHWAMVRCAGLAMGMALGGRRGSRGCQGRTRLRK